MRNIYAYVDGGYLRERAKDLVPATPWLEPWEVCAGSFASPGPHHPPALGTIDRLNFYDAEATDADAPIGAYLKAIQQIPHRSVRLGSIRDGKAKRKQKGVDVRLAVEMLSDAQAGHLEVALLLAGDADFVPVVDEVRRHGVNVVVIAVETSLARTLRSAADEVWPIDPKKLSNWTMTI
ncbi:MAG TPA: NYN domain-containing protein [Dehalococcoidia bacterium]|nr:NYN domain-containing protein [Dehalococcoidia bacterium]